MIGKENSRARSERKIEEERGVRGVSGVSVSVRVTWDREWIGYKVKAKTLLVACTTALLWNNKNTVAATTVPNAPKPARMINITFAGNVFTSKSVMLNVIRFVAAGCVVQ
jgi:hypothetical protein